MTSLPDPNPEVRGILYPMGKVSKRTRVTFLQVVCGVALLWAAGGWGADSTRVPNRKFPMVAVSPLLAPGLDENQVLEVTEALREELVNSGEVRVMERAYFERLVTEKSLSAFPGCDQVDCAVEWGRQLSMDKMVVGSVEKQNQSYSISAQLIDVDQKRVLGTSHGEGRGAFEEVVFALVPNLVLELVADFLHDQSLASLPMPFLGEENLAPETPGPIGPNHPNLLWFWGLGTTSRESMAPLEGTATSPVLQDSTLPIVDPCREPRESIWPIP